MGVSRATETCSSRLLTSLDWPWHSFIHSPIVHSLSCCSTLCDPMDGTPPGSSVRGIFQARRLECVAMLSFRGSS